MLKRSQSGSKLGMFRSNGPQSTHLEIDSLALPFFVQSEFVGSELGSGTELVKPGANLALNV
jgi:hypothetical protein